MNLKTQFLLIFLFCFIIFDSVSAQEICFNGFFKPNSTYDLNRRQILSSHASNVTTHKGFFNSSIGQSPNRIYSIAMCIPGTKPETCSDCIKGASDDLLQSCLNQTDAYTWPDCCMVRYSNISISGSLDMEPSQMVTSTTIDINSNVSVFDIIGEDLMSRTITPSRTHGNKYYAAGVASLKTFQTVYAMMQCTPDIPPGYCVYCLRQNLHDYGSCCRDKQGGSVIIPICFIRWDLHLLLELLRILHLPPPQPQSQPPISSKDGKTISMGTIVAIVVPSVVFLALLVIRFFICRRRNSYQTIEVQVGEEITTIHSLQFDFKTIEAATDKFSDSNMIGRGGFGEVYRGMLSNGTEVAVKRLSKTSGQGAQEFKSEAVLVTKLQHRNLVRLLGFCLEGEEKILVYEYLTKASHVRYDIIA